MNNKKVPADSKLPELFCLNIGNAFDLLFWYVYTI